MKTLAVLTAALALGTCAAGAQENAVPVDSAAGFASIAADQSAGADTTRPPADFIDVDTQPAVIVSKDPVYPALALKAGMEGKVWVKIWVDKSGMPRDVVVLKSDAAVFNGSAMEAARQFRFTPARIKGKPVDVWVSVPFRFKRSLEAEPARTDTVYGDAPPEMMRFVRFVLEGGPPDTGSVSSILGDRAQAVAGGYLYPLPLALKEQREGKKTIEDPGRKVAFFTYGMAQDGRSGYLVARTEMSGKDSRPHYHTIVIQQDAGGLWKIVHWHTWHASR
jgi:TonB family protein